MDENALEIISKGALWLDDDGFIIRIGDRLEILSEAQDAEIIDHSDAWLIPGLVDGHIHFPQYYATASYGNQLLDWLERSVFPREQAFADPRFAEDTAHRFVGHLQSVGTTTAMVFGSQFLGANLALFKAAEASGLRLISGMTLMDCGAPQALLQTAEQAVTQSEALIAWCKNKSFLHYAVTPRFALSCSEAMLEACGYLFKKHPDCYLQTHINENLQEIAAVAERFSWSRDYLDVYQRFGLISDRTVLAHNIHVSQNELERIRASGCSVCHCPGSNLYLGSGLFSLKRHPGIPVAIGSDIGAGTSFSIWHELAETYKIQQLNGFTLTAAEMLYLGTLGGAKALRLDDSIGNFESGKCADFFVLEAGCNGYLVERLKHCETETDQLFCWLHLANEQQIKTTYSQGKAVWNPAP